MNQTEAGMIIAITQRNDGHLEFHIATEDNRGFDARESEMAPFILEQIRKHGLPSELGRHVVFATKTIRIRRRKKTKKFVIAIKVGVNLRWYLANRPQA